MNLKDYWQIVQLFFVLVQHNIEIVDALRTISEHRKFVWNLMLNPKYKTKTNKNDEHKENIQLNQVRLMKFDQVLIMLLR